MLFQPSISFIFGFILEQCHPNGELYVVNSVGAEQNSFRINTIHMLHKSDFIVAYLNNRLYLSWL